MPVLDLLLPSRCVGCARGARPLCPGCAAAFARLALPGHGWTLLAPAVAAVGAYAYTGVVRAAVHTVKVRGAHRQAVHLRDLLHTRVRLPAVPVTWVPASPRRLRERGFDLARILAGPNAVALLRRVAERPDQTALDARARRCSPSGSFAPIGGVPPVVVVVDDVRTTGATARAAADALHEAGARRVLVVTLAVAGQDARHAALGYPGGRPRPSRNGGADPVRPR